MRVIVINSKRGRIYHRTPVKKPKIALFPTPLSFDALAWGVRVPGCNLLHKNRISAGKHRVILASVI